MRLWLRDGRTEVRDARHRGPLRIQRAFHPELDGAAHLVLLHPPAGLVSGDRLQIDLEVEHGARALFTTTGAGKAYRSSGAEASTTTRLVVGAGADAELVPQESVIFDGARARLHTQVELDADARFLGWEVVCLGRPACGERFERGVIEGGDPLLDAAFGMQGWPAFGTLVATHASLDAVRDAIVSFDAPVAATSVESGDRAEALVVVRALGRDGAHARSALERARHAVRTAWSRPPVDPAIWRS